VKLDRDLLGNRPVLWGYARSVLAWDAHLFWWWMMTSRYALR